MAEDDVEAIDLALLEYTRVLFPECSIGSLEIEWRRMPIHKREDCRSAMRAAIRAFNGLVAPEIAK